MAKGKEKEDGPSKNQLRGLQYNHNLPAFLRNAQTALSGGTGQRSSDGRPPIPTRPGNNDDSDDDDDNKLDERDLGDEAPQVVVLNESRDLTAAEADIAKQNASIQLADPKEPIAKKGASLRFNNNNEKTSTNKRKIIGRSYEEDDNDAKNDGVESFGDLVKRAKVDPNNAVTMKDSPTSEVSKPVKKDATKSEMKEGNGNTQQKEKKMLSKEEKAAMKAKRKSAKKLLSFED